MKKLLLILVAVFGTCVALNAQNVDLTNGINYIRIQPAGQSGFTRAFGLNSSNHLYIGSVEQTIGNIYFFNKGTGHLMTLLSNGNVGIGTTNPSSKLTINDGTQKVNFLVNKKLTGVWPAVTENATVTMQATGTIGGNLAFATGNTERMRIQSNGNVGIGTTNPSSKLYINESTGDGVISKNGLISSRRTITTSNVTSYDKSIYAGLINYTIPAGITDNGYKIGVDASAYSGDTNFAGTLKSNYGVWARAGIHKGVSGAKIINAIGVNAEVLDNEVGTTITNAYGVKISTNNYDKTTVTNRYDLYAGTSKAKNYFAGKVGIGTTSPEGNLQVGSSTAGMVFLGGGKGYSGIGSTRSDGGLALGYNIYSRYNDASDNRIARVGTTHGYKGYSGMKFSQRGVIDFFGTDQAVTVDEVANTSERSKMRILGNGNVGIGTTTPDAKLAVNGNIHTQEVKVDMIGWPDFVFENDYVLPTLQEVEEHIAQKGHLKDIPSAKDVEENGILLGEMDAKLLQKIEELTLYTLEQEEKIQKLEQQNTELTTLSEKLLALQTRLEKIEHTQK